ncbi:CMP-N-acetylneuraminate-poly-alpha-2,8-sialyltransferase-like [Branchiostoma floridae x Branchiostoma belcheri]
MTRFKFITCAFLLTCAGVYFLIRITSGKTSQVLPHLTRAMRIQPPQPTHPPQPVYPPRPTHPPQPVYPPRPTHPPRPTQPSRPHHPPQSAHPTQPPLVFGKLAPESPWKFSTKALKEARNISAELNFQNRLRKLGKFPKNATIRHYNTCAVVGNSGVLLGSQCGAEIDSMDFVMRIDLPVIRGYERDVGKRTSMVFFNLKGPDRIRQSSAFKNRSRDVYESRFKDVEGAVLLVDRRAVKNIQTAVKTYKLSFPMLRPSGKIRTGVFRAASKIAKKRMEGIPSIGLVSVLMMTTFCDHPYIYGFYPFTQDANNNTILYHYYPGDFVDPPLEHKFAPMHHMNQEYDFHRELHRRGVLKMQVGPCGKQ